jgi:hypothetical protein
VSHFVTNTSHKQTQLIVTAHTCFSVFAVRWWCTGTEGTAAIAPHILFKVFGGTWLVYVNSTLLMTLENVREREICYFHVWRQQEGVHFQHIIHFICIGILKDYLYFSCIILMLGINCHNIS